MTSHIRDMLTDLPPARTFPSGSVDLSFRVHEFICCRYDKSDGKVILVFDITLSDSIRMCDKYFFKVGKRVLMYIKRRGDRIIEYHFSASPHYVNWVSFDAVADQELYDMYNSLIKRFDININELEREMKKLTQ